VTQEHVRKNRAYWNADAGAYQQQHGARLSRTAMAWGVWRIPESRIHALGEVGGKDLLELGCGAAQWSVALARRGARVAGLDVSEQQLDHARRRIRRARADVPLVQASAEELPFADASFDVLFCDHGAMSFADPRRTVPEAARVLRPGGLLTFSTDTPWHFVCWDDESEQVGRELREDYFAMRTGDDEATVQFQLPYGDWIRLFRASGFVVEDLIELRPPPNARTTYEGWVSLEWARRWPAEHVWKARKAEA
jgi:SAM-dependent methyltransferase